MGLTTNQLPNKKSHTKQQRIRVFTESLRSEVRMQVAALKAKYDPDSVFDKVWWKVY